MSSYVKITDLQTNTPRRNSFRNQIGYILVRNIANTKVSDSKATISTTTKSDHEPVIAVILRKYQKLKAPTIILTYVIQ